jgi:putative transposase
VLEAMKSLSAQYPRYGYRRIRIFLRRQGFELSWSRTHRIWRQAGLLLPKKRSRKRIASGRPRAHTPFKVNMVRAYDFVFDTTADGRQIKCLTVVDEYTRECLAIDVAGAIRSQRVIEVLSRLVSQRGAPLFMRSDNGPEFVSHAILEWIAQAGIGTSLSDPGKPWQNGTDESFNGKFRDECLSLEWFRSRREAQVVIEAWRQHYNAVRPHSSLDYLTPNEFKQQYHSIPNPDGVDRPEALFYRLDQDLAHQLAGQPLALPSGPGHHLAVAAVLGERGSHRLARVALDLQAVRAPAQVTSLHSHLALMHPTRLAPARCLGQQQAGLGHHAVGVKSPRKPDPS